MRQYGELLKITAEMIVEQAEQLAIDLTIPRVACVLQLHMSPKSNTQHNELNTILQLLDTPERGNLVAITSMSELVILKPAFLNGKDWEPEQESRRIDLLLERLPNQLKHKVKIALGHYFPDPKDINLSYQTAKETLLFGAKTAPVQKNIYLNITHCKYYCPISKIIGKKKSYFALTSHD